MFYGVGKYDPTLAEQARVRRAEVCKQFGMTESQCSIDPSEFEDSKPTQPQPPPDQQFLIDKAFLKLKAARSAALLLAGALEDLTYRFAGEQGDLNYYRTVVEKCGPILNSLCDRMEAAQAILRMEAERQCRKEV